MENQVTTVICPNCGASAHNLHNCEFCGSFLVQRAAEGKDLRDYVSKAAHYPISGLVKAIRQYAEILQSEPQLTECWLHFFEGFLANLVPSKGRHVSTGELVGEDGFEICIADFGTASNEAQREFIRLFKNSEAFPVFEKETTQWVDECGNKYNGATYSAKFGYDSEGAARVVYQLLEAVHVNVSEVTPQIYSSDHDYILFNSRGEIIEKEGDGTYLFKGVGAKEELTHKRQPSQQQSATEQQNDSDDFKWKNWMTWVAVGGGILLFRLLIGY